MKANDWVKITKYGRDYSNLYSNYKSLVKRCVPIAIENIADSDRVLIISDLNISRAKDVQDAHCVISWKKEACRLATPEEIKKEMALRTAEKI